MLYKTNNECFNSYNGKNISIALINIHYLYVMSCYAMLSMLCYVMLCYVMLCYVMLCYAVFCCVVYAMSCYFIVCYFCLMLCHFMLDVGKNLPPKGFKLLITIINSKYTISIIFLHYVTLH